MFRRFFPSCQQPLRYGFDIGFSPGRRGPSFLNCRCNSSASSSSSSSSSTTQAVEKVVAEEKAKDGDDELAFLPRPLGIFDQPTMHQKSWKESTLELMDQDVRLERRRHIIKEASKGYYSDLNATRKHGGKTWIAPRTLIREDHALYFPDVVGVPLDRKEAVHTTDICKGKISVIAMLSTVISEEHVDSFVRATNEEYLSDPRYQFIQINLQENLMKAFLVSLYVSSLRRRISKELQSTYLLSKQNMEYVREPLGMNNKHIGFVYLIDPNLRIRWAGGGLAHPEESDSLKRCVRVLLDRVKKGGENGRKS